MPHVHLLFVFDDLKIIFLVTSLLWVSGKMGIKLKIDERGRITLPAEVRKALKIKKGTEITAEEMEEGLLIYKKITPEEFLKEAHDIQEKIKATKVAKEEVLKVKEIWKGEP